ncbi:MAG: Holliday junction branch migration protein RuvA [Acidimicrobiales bacterium]
MIGWLRGRLAARLAEGEVIVDVGGVGYRLVVPAPTLAVLGTEGDEVTLHVHTHVREDALVLYGFAGADERRCFEALLGAHGVGPALAVSILAALSPADLVRAVIEEDLDVLCGVPGIGKKTAARLVLDLRSRLSVPDLGASAVPGGGAGQGHSTSAPRQDVRAALAELGYGADEIRLALAQLHDEGSVEDLLRQALRELAGAR